MKNTVHEVKSRLDTAEDKISRTVDITVQANQHEREIIQGIVIIKGNYLYNNKFK